MEFPESKIIIRCALQKTEDLTVVCPHDWTVLRLKQHLRDMCPNEPTTNRQKLIYAGQCLKDSDLIGGVLRPELADPGDSKAAHTFHLVYTPTVEQIQKEKANAKSELRQRKPVSGSTAPSTNPTVVPPVASNPPNSFWPTAAGGLQFGGVPTQAPAPVAQPDQQNWMQVQQQMYNDYMANYMNYMNQVYGAMNGTGPFINPGLALSPVPSAAPPVAEAPPAGAVPVNPLDAQEPAAGPAQPAQPAGAAAPAAEAAMNAQGGFDEDDLRDRDWLDWIYVASRAGLLVMILYFYSSIERFAVVMLCCAMFYGFQAGWFGLRGARQVNENNDQEQPPAAAEEPENQAEREAGAEESPGDSSEGETQNEAGETGPNSSDSTPAGPPIDTRSPWVVFYQTCFTFITTFFTSMIPDRPPPVNVN